MTNEYFLDQYGHIYRWEKTAYGMQAIPVANFQNSGSAKECALLLEKANAFQRDLKEAA